MTSRPLGSTRLGMSAADGAASGFAITRPDDWTRGGGLIAAGVCCPASGAINEKISARVTRIRFTVSSCLFPRKVVLNLPQHLSGFDVGRAQIDVKGQFRVQALACVCSAT